MVAGLRNQILFSFKDILNSCNQPFIENKPVISGLISFVIPPQAQCPLVRARMLPERPSEFLPDRSVYVKIQSGRFRRNLAHPQVVTAAFFTQTQNY